MQPFSWGRHSCLPFFCQRHFVSDMRIARRKLPHWELEGSTYFITFRVACGSLDADERRAVLEHIRSGDGRFYHLAAAMVMPDHVHLLLRPAPGVSLECISKGIKGPAARTINKRRGTKGRLWQDERWDRIVRDQEEFEEKLRYMFGNPVKAGLVDDPSQYEGWYCGEA